MLNESFICVGHFIRTDSVTAQTVAPTSLNFNGISSAATENVIDATAHDEMKRMNEKLAGRKG